MPPHDLGVGSLGSETVDTQFDGRDGGHPDRGAVAGTVAGRMYRFLLRPRWIVFTVVVAAAVVVMINLGFWQLRRLDERRQFNADVESRIDQPAVVLDELVPRDAAVGDEELAEIEWRPVTATGRYLPDEQLRVINRSTDGQPADVLVTPLELEDGRLLLVARGFVPIGDDEPPDPPSGQVTVTGRLRESEGRRRGQLTDSDPDDDLVPRIDIPLLAEQLPAEPVPMYVELTDSDPPEAGQLPQPIDRPELGEGPHLSYAIQWFAFSTLAVVGWVLAVRHSRRAVSDPRSTSGGQRHQGDE